MAGLGRPFALGIHIPKSLKPNAGAVCWVLHNSNFQLELWEFGGNSDD
jgi:hypothetical protein